jgi:hypothetical protein
LVASASSDRCLGHLVDALADPGQVKRHELVRTRRVVSANSVAERPAIDGHRAQISREIAGFGRLRLHAA